MKAVPKDCHLHRLSGTASRFNVPFTNHQAIEKHETNFTTRSGRQREGSPPIDIPDHPRYYRNMPRTARIVLPGVAHHITQRGNDKRDVFLDSEDFYKYMSLMTHHYSVHGLRVISYCLMTNHIHIVGVPRAKESLADAVGRTHFQYSNYFKQKYHHSGHLWQSRFYSCPMDEDHTINALAYVELNPVRAGMVDHPWDYEWSSANVHCTSPASSTLLHLERWRSRFSPEEWRDILLESAGKAEAFATIRKHSRQGKPLGNAAFLERVRAMLKTQGLPSTP